MKTIIAFAFVVALALAAPQDDDKNAQSLKYENDYKFAFETSDGIQRQEQADDGEAQVVRGSYSYVGDDGQVYTVNYVADENGFRPEGAHVATGE